MHTMLSVAALALMAGSAPLIAQPAPAPAQGPAIPVARNVVLVHGAWPTARAGAR